MYWYLILGEKPQASYTLTHTTDLSSHSQAAAVSISPNSVYSLAGLRRCSSHTKGEFGNSGARTPHTPVPKQQSDLLTCSHLSVVSGSSTHTDTGKADQVGQEWPHQQARETGTVPFRPVSLEGHIFWSQETWQRNDLESCIVLTKDTHNSLWMTWSDHKCHKPQNSVLDLNLFYIQIKRTFGPKWTSNLW